jgi:hypothetical protein
MFNQIPVRLSSKFLLINWLRFLAQSSISLAQAVICMWFLWFGIIFQYYKITVFPVFVWLTKFSGISDLNMGLTPLTNRVYTSGVDLIYLNSQINVNKDWFNCTWSAVPAPLTTDFKRESHLKKNDVTLIQNRFLICLVCRHGGTTSSSGTLQPFLDGLTTGEPRECYFFIESPLNEEIEFSCSSLNLTSPGSYLRVKINHSFPIFPSN